MKSRKMEHEGVLIRANDGFACIHPWEIFGDEPVDVQLAEMKDGTATRLGKRALYAAELDGDARRRGVSLFDDLAVPESHGTVVAGLEQVEDLVAKGFNTLKIKAGSDVDDDAAKINELSTAFPNVRLRIDFNCNYSGSEVGDFIELLSDESRDAVEYLEDPCGYGDSCWTGLRNLYGLKLAMDIGVEKVDALYSYSIIKPAKNNPDKVANEAMANARRCVVTSYMDHPVGQAYAAYEAGLVRKNFPGLSDRAGLMTHGLFEQDGFSQTLGELKPKWTHSTGYGIGFDDLLESLEWTKLG